MGTRKHHSNFLPVDNILLLVRLETNQFGHLLMTGWLCYRQPGTQLMTKGPGRRSITEDSEQ
jgi:hypothetical protein